MKIASTLRDQKNLVIFDVDGTLINTDEKFIECIRLTLSKKLDKQISVFEVRSKMASRFSDLFANFEIHDKSELLDSINIFSLFWHKVPVPIKLYFGVRQLLEKCSSAGFKMVVWSARDAATVEESLKAVGVRDFFQEIFCYSHEFGGKPIPETNLRKLTSQENRRCVLIGDSDVDLFAAQEIQAKFFRAEWKANASSVGGYRRPEDCLADLLNYFEGGKNVHNGSRSL